MKGIRLALIAVLVMLAGCGGEHHRSVPTTPTPARITPTCHPHAFAHAGECIRQDLEHAGLTPARPPSRAVQFGAVLPLAFYGQSAIDISVYQGTPNFFQARLAGLRYAVVQTNDGTAGNPRFGRQAEGLRLAGVPFGIYAFVRPFSGAAQARFALAIARGAGASSAWADVEVPGSYWQACSFIAQAHTVFRVVGKYGSPGLVEGPACQGYDWPAEWGSGRPYPLPGYTTARTILRQNCGTCHFPGVGGEVDTDETLGLLALIAPTPKPTPAHLVTRIRVLRVLLTRHHCRQPPWHIAVGPRGHPNGRYQHVCHTWLIHGRTAHRELGR